MESKPFNSLLPEIPPSYVKMVRGNYPAVDVRRLAKNTKIFIRIEAVANRRAAREDNVARIDSD